MIINHPLVLKIIKADMKFKFQLLFILLMPDFIKFMSRKLLFLFLQISFLIFMQIYFFASFSLRIFYVETLTQRSWIREL